MRHAAAVLVLLCTGVLAYGQTTEPVRRSSIRHDGLCTSRSPRRPHTHSPVTPCTSADVDCLVRHTYSSVGHTATNSLLGLHQTAASTHGRRAWSASMAVDADHVAAHVACEDHDSPRLLAPLPASVRDAGESDDSHSTVTHTGQPHIQTVCSRLVDR
jgi:hypothetical protein